MLVILHFTTGLILLLLSIFPRCSFVYSFSGHEGKRQIHVQTCTCSFFVCSQHEEEGKKIENCSTLFANQTAVIVSDMWDQHWCPPAMERAKRLARKINRFLHTLRSYGVTIIFSPADVVSEYKNSTMAYWNTLTVPSVEITPPIQSWKSIDSYPPLPFPAGCNSSEHSPVVYNWKKQSEILEIYASDFIAADEKVYYILQAKSIRNVIVTGIHLNACVLSRPYGLIQLKEHKYNVLLARDLTDSIHLSRYLSHDDGIKKFIDYVEKYICPTFSATSMYQQEE